MIDYFYEFLQTSQLLFFLVMVAGLLITLEVGRVFGRRRRATIGEGADEGASLVVGSLLGLMAFVLALNLSNATSRYEMRLNATLDEVNDADLVLHVVDSSSDYFEVQMRVVEEVLTSLGAIDTPRIDVYNKIDKPESKPRSSGVAISAVSSAGIDTLLHAIEEALAKTQVKLEVVVPYDKHGAMQLIRQSATILSETHEEDGTHLTLLLNESETWRIKKAISG